jgi:hypothetical protein
LAIAMLAPAAFFETEAATRIPYVVIRPNQSATVGVRHNSNRTKWALVQFAGCSILPAVW